MNIVHGLLILPETQQVVKCVFDDDDLSSIYSLIGADCFDVVRLAPDVICFVDDNGLFTKSRWSFKHPNYPQPLAGRGLLAGTDDFGETLDFPGNSALWAENISIFHNPEGSWNMTDIVQQPYTPE